MRRDRSTTSPLPLGRDVARLKGHPEGLTEEEAVRIRLRTQTGRPLGSDSFVSKPETLLGRRIRPLPVGRPRKTPTKDRKPGGNQVGY